MDRLDAMRVLLRVAELGSFTRAADELQLPRATVTHTIQALEQHLGVRLLNRTTRHVSATPDGEDFLPEAALHLAKAGGKRFRPLFTVLSAQLGPEPDAWQVTVAGRYQTGFPLNISQSSNNSNLLGSNQRPNIVPGVDPMTTGSQRFASTAREKTRNLPMKPAVSGTPAARLAGGSSTPTGPTRQATPCPIIPVQVIDESVADRRSPPALRTMDETFSV